MLTLRLRLSSCVAAADDYMPPARAATPLISSGKYARLPPLPARQMAAFRPRHYFVAIGPRRRPRRRDSRRTTDVAMIFDDCLLGWLARPPMSQRRARNDARQDGRCFAKP